MNWPAFFMTLGIVLSIAVGIISAVAAVAWLADYFEVKYGFGKGLLFTVLTITGIIALVAAVVSGVTTP